MIAKLNGLVDSFGDGWVIIDVQGVGYLVQASSRTLSGLPPVGGAISLYIETVVREDAITLFGFADVDERDMFLLLTSVQGVGAKVGLALLSVADPLTMQTAIAAGDKTTIASANGVGPKLAARIANELKDKVTNLSFGSLAGLKAHGGAAASLPKGAAVDDAVSALVNLGYRPTDAYGAVARAQTNLGQDADVSSLITASLKELSGTK